MLQILLRTLESRVHNDLVAFLRHERRGIWLVRVLGAWDYELIFEVEDNDEMTTLQQNLQAAIPRLIQRMNCVPELARRIKEAYPLGRQ